MNALFRFAGLQLLIVIPFNFAWTINTTPIALYKDVAYLRRSPSTVVGGIFFLLGFTASLYHLLFLILLNFYALWWKTSLVHPKQRKAAFGLAVVWIAGLLSAVVPSTCHFCISTSLANFPQLSWRYLFRCFNSLRELKTGLKVNLKQTFIISSLLLPYADICVFAYDFSLHTGPHESVGLWPRFVLHHFHCRRLFNPFRLYGRWRKSLIRLLLIYRACQHDPS